MAEVDIDLTINGRRIHRKSVPSDLRLVDFLNEDLGLTGTKFCCGIGVCRACTVIANRESGAAPVPVLACSVPVADLNGQSITTVEGLAPSPQRLTVLQQAFLDEFAFQCGYCTPGFLMAAHGMMERLRLDPAPIEVLDETILQSCSQNICRCTGYVRYHSAIRKAVLQTPGLIKHPLSSGAEDR
jgi:aerobic-type carbon monoxide dehydrogenase small subunit (CoxS/CutS family)